MGPPPWAAKRLGSLVTLIGRRGGEGEERGGRGEGASWTYTPRAAAKDPTRNKRDRNMKHKGGCGHCYRGSLNGGAYTLSRPSVRRQPQSNPLSLRGCCRRCLPQAKLLKEVGDGRSNAGCGGAGVAAGEGLHDGDPALHCGLPDHLVTLQHALCSHAQAPQRVP